jgi:hypothetical protein
MRPAAKLAAEQAVYEAAKAKAAAGTVTVTVGGLRLYVDCLPTKGDPDYSLAEDWAGPMIAELNEWALEDHKMIDYRLLPYAQEKAAFTAAVQKRATAKMGLPPAIVLSTSSQLGKELLPLLTPFARVIVRALRG